MQIQRIPPWGFLLAWQTSMSGCSFRVLTSLPSASMSPQIFFSISRLALVLLIATGAAKSEDLLGSSDTLFGGQLTGDNFQVGVSGGAAGANNWPGAEGPGNAVDGVGQKYLNFAEFNTGIVVTPGVGPSVATSLKLWAANDAEERDPASYEIYGTNAALGNGPFQASTFILISSGDLTLPFSRNTGGGAALNDASLQTVEFNRNGTVYTSYMIIFPTVKNAGIANSMQIAEIQLDGSVGLLGDLDGDGLSDDYENANGLDANDDGAIGESSPGAKDGPNGALGDPDEDGLSNTEERDLGTDPQEEDSDQDGLTDGLETRTGIWVSESDTGTNPLDPDSDDDALLDGAENPWLAFDSNNPTSQPGTNPNLDDTDGDTVPDGEEVAAGRNPTFMDPLPPTIFMRGDAILGGSIANNWFEVGVPGGGEGINSWPANEAPEFAIDGVGQKYLNFAEFNSGILVTPSRGLSVATSLTLWTANDDISRDPASYELYGTTSDVSGAGPFDLDQFTLISSGDLALPDSRNQGANTDLDEANSQSVFFSNSDAYTSYLLVFPTVKDSNNANSMQIAEVQLGGQFGPGTPLRFEVEGLGNELVFTFDSQTGKVYDILSSIEPENESDPSLWGVWQENITATPPENVETFPRPADTERFFALVKKVAPAFFSEDFENGAAGWTSITNDGSGATIWERGSPNASTGPTTGADRSSNAFTTNIGDYGPNSDIALRSPVVDLTVASSTEATLSFQQFRDADGFADVGTVRVLRSGDLSELSTLDADLTILDSNWTDFSALLPANVIGESIILEFQFTSGSGGDSFSGWSIDNVEINLE